MDWYYAEGSQKRGPLPELEIKSRIASGAITPETLVWNASFTDWKKARETSLFAETLEPGHQRCIITGKIYPESQMLKTERGWVSAEGKDVYYQSLREGAPIPTSSGVSNARRDGKKVVVPAEGARLPMRCVKTNQPVTDAEVTPKTLYWASPILALTILISILIYLIIYLIVRKKVVIPLPLSAAGKGIMRKHLFISLGICVAGIVALVVGAVNSHGAAGVLILVGVLMVLGGLVYGVIRASALRIAKMKDGEVWLVGACPEFLDSLPPR